MAIERYNPRDAEPRWQQKWNEDKVFVTDNSDPREKYYVLEMFPYPSGRIHMGHVRNYAMGDVVARYKRARGFNVLHPMGWDAFGMPAENAAMQNKVHPKDWTYQNIATMRGQLKSMGLSLDWTREFATCDVEYYHRQQALFVDFMEKGLVYRKQSKVNWDPVDHTVLANEQVIDGRGWRSGALVEQRELTQWFFRITDFSQDLLDELDTLDQWPEKVRLMQKNWIGRSEGLALRWQTVADTAPEGFSDITVPDWISDADQKKLNAYDKDEAKATSLLQAAGWKKSGGKWMLPNGKPAFATADGAFTANIRAIVMMDAGKYFQDNNLGSSVVGRDLNEGVNFRRARIGFDGRVFKDFDYSMGSTIAMIMAVIMLVVIAMVMVWRATLYRGSTGGKG